MDSIVLTKTPSDPSMEHQIDASKGHKVTESHVISNGEMEQLVHSNNSSCNPPELLSMKQVQHPVSEVNKIHPSNGKISEKKNEHNQEIDDPHDADTSSIKFKDWGFEVDRLFEVAYRFYKRNEMKAFHPSFDVRNQMNALILQARYGNFDSGRAPDIGVLDLVGKNRRYQWSLLKGLSKTEAMSKFIISLDKICPFFMAYAEAVKISTSQAQSLNSNMKRSQVASNGFVSSNVDLVSTSESDILQEQSEKEQQLNAIQKSLSKQTYEQFRRFALKQFPEDREKQKSMITTLQEQYYLNYISQMHPDLLEIDRSISVDQNHALPPKPYVRADSNSMSSNGVVVEPDHYDKLGPTSNSFVTSTNKISHSYFPPDYSQFIPNTASIETAQDITDIEVHNQGDDVPLEEPDYHSEQKNIIDHVQQLVQESNESKKTVEYNTKDSWDTTDLNVINSNERENEDDVPQDSPSDPSSEFVNEPIEAVSMWSKKGFVNAFRESMADNSQGGSYLVNQGSLLIIQVPTYPDGRYIYFEFATEDYDIGFGLDFVYVCPTEPLPEVRVYEENDEDDEDEDLDVQPTNSDTSRGAFERMRRGGDRIDLESANIVRDAYSYESRMEAANRQQLIDRRKSERENKISSTVSIVSTYRRDSHEEVIIGRHRYPGRGYYLLKFDNTYSVLRSKSLYFRVCYYI